MMKKGEKEIFRRAMIYLGLVANVYTEVKLRKLSQAEQDNKITLHFTTQINYKNGHIL